ncbi:uroporphyrinogen-III synthase [Thiohalocapsa marina]|uniref:Uroporphyrinogen-III synthase n=1 Tax=Thiohalocapsa marina TaxID=424902 RepID=A0A5M8FSL2_9GAMM|nr:uroporphyrinogen-III synthase [Thiohalocapsa marina]KAA6185272.1 uroporphyrinogen-III synthase [Thiohalocapsa marina]
MSGPCRLNGRGVLITRPAAQADALSRLVAELDGEPILFPTVEILPTLEAEAARAQLRQPWDLMVFVSRNAVEHALALLGGAEPLAHTRLAAVGKATAAAIRAAGLPSPLVPASGFDSEALLQLPELTAVAGRRVLIVRGDGGRPLLRDTLRQRGAEAAFAEVYRRVPPQVDVGALLPQWESALGYVTATSDEVLANLMGLLPPAAYPWMFGLPLAVLSERNAQTALAMGFRTVAVASEASDAGLCDALCRLHLARVRP